MLMPGLKKFQFAFIYSDIINKIKALLTTSIRNIKCNKSLTDRSDLVYTPKTLEEVIKALENTVITGDNINIYSEVTPITMDRKTHQISFVYEKNIQYEKLIELLAEQFSANEELSKLKTLCYKFTQGIKKKIL